MSNEKKEVNKKIKNEAKTEAEGCGKLSDEQIEQVSGGIFPFIVQDSRVKFPSTHGSE